MNSEEIQHVTDPRFGIGSPSDEQLNKLIASGRTFSASDAHLLRSQFYDEHYKIRDYNGVEGTHPYSLILMSPKEDYVTNGAFHRVASDFVNYKVGEFFKISLLDYLKLEPNRADILKEICMTQIQENNVGVDDASAQIARAQKQINDAVKNR